MTQLTFIQLQIHMVSWMDSCTNVTIPLNTIDYPWSYDLTSFNFLMMLFILILTFCHFPFLVFMLVKNCQAKFYTMIFLTYLVNAINVNLFTLTSRNSSNKSKRHQPSLQKHQKNNIQIWKNPSSHVYHIHNMISA